MNKRKPTYPKDRPRDERRMNLRTLSNRILECANSSLRLVQFLKEVSQMLIDFTGCDVLRLVLQGRNLFYRCEITGDADQPFRFETTPDSPDRRADRMWSSGLNKTLEQLCQDIINGDYDPTQPHFTDNGSLWTGNLKALTITGLDESGQNGGPGIRIDTGCRSFALIPIEAGRECIGLLQLGSQTENFFTEQDIEACERLAQVLGIAHVHRRLQVALRERVKELTCLHGIAKLVTRPGTTLDEVLQKTVELLPPAWLYPDVTSARIVFNDRTFHTRGFRKPAQSMRADIDVDRKQQGFVEVGYIWERPSLDEGPFLIEERHLIDAVAHEVSAIIEQRQAEEEKLKLQEQLRHADRLATIGQLGAGLAHELNEPLSNILGFAQLAAKDRKLTEQTRQDLGKIISASLHAREVISKLLLFARETTSEKASVNLNALIEDGLHFLRSRCVKGGIDLRLNLARKLTPILADPGQLLQVLTNLIVNSIQAMPHGGHLTISTTQGTEGVALIVEDTGTGMSEDVKKNIFNPFFTTKDVDQGTGLGLSVVHGIVTAHRGTIDVESQVGQGTTFVITLPAKPAAGIEEYYHG